MLLEETVTKLPTARIIRPNSRESDFADRLERTRATICSRNFREYRHLDLDIVGSSFQKDQVPTKTGQRQ